LGGFETNINRIVKPEEIHLLTDYQQNMSRVYCFDTAAQKNQRISIRTQL
jgi:hypothetical protein